jgi:hypothetical protein
MQLNHEQDDNQVDSKSRGIEQLLTLILIVLLLVLFAVVVVKNKEKIIHSLFPGTIYNFDDITINNGYHEMSIDNGQTWQLSYEQDHDTTFTGTISHTSPINESAFAILTRDILVTTGDFADPKLVMTSVTDHHFTWRSLTDTTPRGTINLLHTVPMNEEINQQLDAIKNGDSVAIKGFEVYRIEGYDKNGEYIGYWQDSGCNTTLITEVKIIENSGN